MAMRFGGAPISGPSEPGPGEGKIKPQDSEEKLSPVLATWTRT